MSTGARLGVTDNVVQSLLDGAEHEGCRVAFQNRHRLDEIQPDLHSVTVAEGTREPAQRRCQTEVVENLRAQLPRQRSRFGQGGLGKRTRFLKAGTRKRVTRRQFVQGMADHVHDRSEVLTDTIMQLARKTAALSSWTRHTERASRWK